MRWQPATVAARLCAARRPERPSSRRAASLPKRGSLAAASSHPPEYTGTHLSQSGDASLPDLVPLPGRKKSRPAPSSRPAAQTDTTSAATSTANRSRAAPAPERGCTQTLSSSAGNRDGITPSSPESRTRTTSRPAGNGSRTAPGPAGNGSRTAPGPAGNDSRPAPGPAGNDNRTEPGPAGRRGGAVSGLAGNGSRSASGPAGSSGYRTAPEPAEVSPNAGRLQCEVSSGPTACSNSGTPPLGQTDLAASEVAPPGIGSGPALATSDVSKRRKARKKKTKLVWNGAPVPPPAIPPCLSLEMLSRLEDGAPEIKSLSGRTTGQKTVRTSGSEGGYLTMHKAPQPAIKGHFYVNIENCRSSYSEDSASDISSEKLNAGAIKNMLRKEMRRKQGDKQKDRNWRRDRVKRESLGGKECRNTPKVPQRRESRDKHQSGDEGISSDSELAPQSETQKKTKATTTISRRKKLPTPAVFGYDIEDISSFLSQATARTPANIPMVVTSPAELYVLEAATSAESPTVPIHLGLVVNALFKQRLWLFVQTPHRQQGYMACSACTPLGIIPRGAAAWEDQGQTLPPAVSCDPQRSARSTAAVQVDQECVKVEQKNKTDAEKLYENVTSDGRALGLLMESRLRHERSTARQRARSQPASRRRRTSPRRDQSETIHRRHPLPKLAPSRPSAFHPPKQHTTTAPSIAAQATASGGRKVALRSNNKAVISSAFKSRGRNTLTVRHGDVVILLNTSVGDWFWVQDARGQEGYIPSACVGLGLG